MPESAVIPRTGPLTALRRHVWITIALIVVAVAAALAWVALTDRTYTAEARLAVAGTNLTAEQVPGFALASQELAADYARYVNNSSAQSSIREDFGVDDGSVEEIVASSIPESNVVRIEVLAHSEQTAVQVAGALAQRLTDQVNDRDDGAQDATDALTQFTTLSQQVADAQQVLAAAQGELDSALGRASSGFPRRGDDIPALRTAVANAAAQVSVLQVQQTALGERYNQLISDIGTSSDLSVIQNATSQGDDVTARAQRFGLLGLVIGLALAVLVALRLEARRRTSLPPAVESQAGPEAGPDTGPEAGPEYETQADGAAVTEQEPSTPERAAEDAADSRSVPAYGVTSDARAN